MNLDDLPEDKKQIMNLLCKNMCKTLNETVARDDVSGAESAIIVGSVLTFLIVSHLQSLHASCGEELAVAWWMCHLESVARNAKLGTYRSISVENKK